MWEESLSMIFQLFLYFSLAALIVGVAAKAIKIINMPVHLRWDLYPIPHEKGKEHYGGSYYEESDWWTKPANFSLVSEVKEMGKEIIAIQSLFRNNRSLWYFSFPFHFGLYLLTAFAGLLYLGAALQERGVEVSIAAAGPVGKAIFILTLVCGVGGWILGIFGALGLLLARFLRDELRRYSTRGDYINLLLLLAVFLFGFLAWLLVDRSFDVLRRFTQEFMVFRPLESLPTLVTVQLVLTSAFFIYLPFTHMTHFVGKYFTYHKVRWQDEPNWRGGATEGEILEALKERLSWRAPHIRTGKSWAEAATAEDDGKEGKK
jgi:nitrate reductase gamma subunit